VEPPLLIQQRITAFRAERDTLLQRIREALEGDPRVVAAWLFGSLGRGGDDALSDLDLFVVAADDAIQEVVEGRQRFMAQFGPPLLIVDAPQNAPKGGAYNMALYPGADGPHQVDWYWQPQSAAQIPSDTRLLFDRAGLPRLDGPTTFEGGTAPERERLEVVAHAVSFFWAMLLITAKYAARSPREERMGLLKYVCGPLNEVERFLDAPPTSEEGAPHPEPAEKLRVLEQLAGRMEALMPPLRAAGVAVPGEIVPQAQRYLALFAEGWFEAAEE
jgi:predicted nucleotidyltransferase